MNISNINRVPRNVVLKRLILNETGTYNPMFHRPYVSNVQNLSEVVSNLEQRVSTKSSKITAGDVAGITNSVVTPSASPMANANIPNGWQERRARFMLEVEINYSMGLPTTHYFQGFTSHLGMSRAGNIDHSMTFYVNSYMTTVKQLFSGPYGNYEKSRVVESSRVITNFGYNDPYSDPNKAFVMVRPQDIYNTLETSNMQLGSHSLFDTRIMINSDPKVSYRRNDVPSRYLSTLLDSYSKSMMNSDFSSSEKTILAEGRSQVGERPILENAFLKSLINMRGSGMASAFTYRDLLELDPSIDNRAQIVFNSGVQIQQVHSIGLTEHWGGVNYETQVATILSNAVPSIMMDLLIGKIAFTATNDTIGSQVITTITGADTFTDADMTQHFEMFRSRVENEILQDISYNSQVSFSISAIVDVIGETRMTISIDNKAPIEFAVPSFCDSTVSPVVSTTDHYESLASDIGLIMDSVIRNTGFNQNERGFSNV